MEREPQNNPEIEKPLESLTEERIAEMFRSGDYEAIQRVEVLTQLISNLGGDAGRLGNHLARVDVTRSKAEEESKYIFSELNSIAEEIRKHFTAEGNIMF